jgi:hypothetical protein
VRIGEKSDNIRISLTRLILLPHHDYALCILEEIQLDLEIKDCKKGLPFGCFNNVCLMVKKIILFKAYLCKQDVENSALA